MGIAKGDLLQEYLFDLVQSDAETQKKFGSAIEKLSKDESLYIFHRRIEYKEGSHTSLRAAVKFNSETGKINILGYRIEIGDEIGEWNLVEEEHKGKLVVSISNEKEITFDSEITLMDWLRRSVEDGSLIDYKELEPEEAAVPA